MGLIKKSAAAAVGTALVKGVKVTGTPVRDRTKAGAITLFGLPIFERDASLDRVWFGLISRGKSKVAKAYLASQTSEEPEG